MVTTHKRKIDGSEKGPWTGEVISADGAGWTVVYFSRPPHRAGSPPQDVAHALRYYSAEAPLSVLVSFDERLGVLEYQCDAGLPATIEAGRVVFVDLDLDVMADGVLQAYERDEEQFQRNILDMGYQPDVVAQARAGIALAWELIGDRRQPFDGSALQLARDVVDGA